MRPGPRPKLAAARETGGLVLAADTLRTKGARKVGPYMVPRTMSSTVSACLATSYGIQGLNYSISSACATSAHCRWTPTSRPSSRT